MIHTIKKYLIAFEATCKAILLGIRYGKFRHSGGNFTKNRREALAYFQEFIPSNALPLKETCTETLIWKNSLTRNILSQLAFIKHTVNAKGGHLTAQELHLAYIRIPKSASTSMGKVLLENIYPTLKQKKTTEKEINFLIDVNLEAHCTNKSQFYFTIVRNPYSRLVSVYRDFFENNNENYIYRDYLFEILPQHISFDEFIDRIARIPDRLKDQHIKPQHTFLTYYKKQNVQCKIFKLEEPDKLTSFLDPYQMKLPHLNRSIEQYDFRDYYTLTSLKKARKIYSIDIELFGYEMVYNQLADHLKTSSLQDQ